MERPIRHYIVAINGTVAIWEATNVRFLELLKSNPGAKQIGMPFDNGADAAAERQRQLTLR